MPPRCCLSVPGSSDRMLTKARSVEVDEIVIDLEDAVAPEQKAAARAAAVGALGDGPFAAGRVAVRINAPGTPWCHDDVLALAGAPVPPDSLVVPKVECEAELRFVELLLKAECAASGREPTLRLQALIETPRGVMMAGRVAAAVPRLEALIIGYADLAAALQRRKPVVHADWRGIQDQVLMAARGAGLAAIDGPCLRIDPRDELLAQTETARALGYDGKWAIHPSQVAVISDAFSATDEELAQARRILAALEAARTGGAGAATASGTMVDEASCRWATGVLARAGNA
jgi:citrate lyase subunit beta/citryl-CoA lyase